MAMSMVPRYRPNVGVKSDVDNFLKEFADVASVRYEDFNKIWKSKRFYLIYSGRQNSRECREFAEECFSIVLESFTSLGSFQLQVGAIYMLYSLYFTQPIDPPAKIRITMDQWKFMLQIMSEAHEQEHLDLEYVFNMLKAYRAFQFVATMYRIYPNSKSGTSVMGEEEEEEGAGALTVGLQDEQSVLSEILEPPYIDQLSEIHDQYHSIKCMMSGDSRPTASLNMIHTDMVQYITRTMGNHEVKRKKIIGQSTRKRRDSRDALTATTSESEADSDQESFRSESGSPQKGLSIIPDVNTKHVGRRRSELKKRAFQMNTPQSRSRRHRQEQREVKAEEQSSPSKSPTKEPQPSTSTSSPQASRRSSRSKNLMFPALTLSDSMGEDDSDEDVDFVVPKPTTRKSRSKNKSIPRQNIPPDSPLSSTPPQSDTSLASESPTKSPGPAKRKTLSPQKLVHS